MNNYKITKNRNHVYLSLILAIIFGILGGILGFMLTKTYSNNDYMSFWGEINLRNQGINGTSLIIQGAKKVVIEQDEKLNEIMLSTKKSLVGLYEKKSPPTNIININDFYNLKNPDTQGTVITSDGWILFSGNNYELLDKIIVIDANNNFYNPDKIIQDPLTDFYFLHLDKINNLPVRPLASADMVEVGKTIFIQSWNNKILTAKISSINLKSDFLKSSSLNENNFDRIYLDKTINEEFYNSSIFDLEGNIIGFVFKNGEIIPAYVFNSVLNSILISGKPNRPKLGIQYIDLSSWATQSDSLPEFGALIYSDNNMPAIEKGGAAEKAGLKSGDVIIGFDNINLNNKINLSKALSMFSAGQVIRLSFWRSGEKFDTDLTLGEF